MSSHASLEAQANERKARLAQLKSLKRKQDSSDDSIQVPEDTTSKYLSGRNYDVIARGPKSGFETAPTEGQITLEDQAASIAKKTAEQLAEEEKEDRPIDLFKLQPKKPNWDLKRDLDKKMEILNVRTENAIARLVKQRIQEQQAKARRENGSEGGAVDGSSLGMEGTSLLEGVHLREREEEERVGRDPEDEEMI
ncbi:MAG: Protein phosphatase 2C 2 [Chaenotheca gracillima]|nr:MAG: Protein phosphatase 2C 2 [Chaenotheca gracillima]